MFSKETDDALRNVLNMLSVFLYPIAKAIDPANDMTNRKPKEQAECKGKRTCKEEEFKLEAQSDPSAVMLNAIDSSANDFITCLIEQNGNNHRVTKLWQYLRNVVYKTHNMSTLVQARTLTPRQLCCHGKGGNYQLAEKLYFALHPHSKLDKLGFECCSIKQVELSIRHALEHCGEYKPSVAWNKVCSEKYAVIAKANNFTEAKINQPEWIKQVYLDVTSTPVVILQMDKTPVLKPNTQNDAQLVEQAEQSCKEDEEKR